MYQPITTKALALFMSMALVMAPIPATASEGKVASLKKGAPAPYDGVLFDEIFAARLIAEEEHKDIECDLKTNRQIEKLQAQNALDTANLQNRLDLLKEQSQSILHIKDEEIKRLQELALKNPNDNSHWWLGGGVVMGILTSIAIFYAAVEVQK